QALAIEAWLWVLGVGLGFASLYIRWYSRYGKRFNMLLQNGNRLPELSFENPQGETVRLSDFDGPLLLLFYRGNWCPLCMAQIKEVAEQYNALAAKGLKLLMISPQSHANTAELARRFEVPMEFLVDKELKAAKTLGIEALVGLPAGLEVLGYDSDTVMPTVIITDAERRIIFTHQTDNYRVRPEPATFLRALADADI
ncbi:MAG: redoxin domain-containing protein, partial [Ketobacter sp.]|nr:redoxin domain-containing protein [Ketobacter sp.]